MDKKINNDELARASDYRKSLPKEQREKNKHAVALGKSGGKARMAGMSAPEREELARKAAYAMHAKRNAGAGKGGSS